MDPGFDHETPLSPLPSDAANPDILVYIVDDESRIGEVVEVVLKLRGFRPRFFTDPEAALHALIHEDPKPALLLTDFLMNPINGMELIERCKKLQPRLKTILYSGNVGDEITQYYLVKPDGFVSKPFLPATLIATVRKVLES